MFYLVLLVAVITFLSVVAWFDPSQRRKLSVAGAAQGDHRGALAESIAAVAAATLSRFGAHGSLLRVPATALRGERKEDRPCLTPIDCVMDKRCAGHCGCH
ncbi:hypothetical protein [Ramlibacter sp.]|uniref:hypothetical protein n=1 Tax=Ramlibacter sp. TaxID=1917967 RepID=UPI002C461317|nr:hypothetical protein [Ramlibacter sp.]HWI84676.1 hypothetical protein [Ramlibacter sp.]